MTSRRSEDPRPRLWRLAHYNTNLQELLMKMISLDLHSSNTLTVLPASISDAVHLGPASCGTTRRVGGGHGGPGARLHSGHLATLVLQLLQGHIEGRGQHQLAPGGEVEQLGDGLTCGGHCRHCRLDASRWNEHGLLANQIRSVTLYPQNSTTTPAIGMNTKKRPRPNPCTSLFLYFKGPNSCTFVQIPVLSCTSNIQNPVLSCTSSTFLYKCTGTCTFPRRLEPVLVYFFTANHQSSCISLYFSPTNLYFSPNPCTFHKLPVLFTNCLYFSPPCLYFSQTACTFHHLACTFCQLPVLFTH